MNLYKREHMIWHVLTYNIFDIIQFVKNKDSNINYPSKNVKPCDQKLAFQLHDAN